MLGWRSGCGARQVGAGMSHNSDSSIAKRLGVVSDLLEFRRSLAEIALDLKEFPWDYEGVPILLYKRHMDTSKNLA